MATPRPPARRSGRLLIALGLCAWASPRSGSSSVCWGGCRLANASGWDAMNHALLTGNILQHHRDLGVHVRLCPPGRVVRLLPAGGERVLGQAAVLTGGAVSSAMNAWTVVVAPVFLVASVYACVRALGGRPVVAGAAAAAPTAVGPLYASMLTGRITEEVGPALSVGVALLVALAVRGPHPVRTGALAGIGAAGIVMTHTYDVLFTAVLAAGLVLWLPARTDGPAARTLVAATATAGVAAAVALAPFLRGLLGADGDRAAAPPALMGQPGRAWSFWFTYLRRYVAWATPSPAATSSRCRCRWPVGRGRLPARSRRSAWCCPGCAGRARGYRGRVDRGRAVDVGLQLAAAMLVSVSGTAPASTSGP